MTRLPLDSLNWSLKMLWKLIVVNTLATPTIDSAKLNLLPKSPSQVNTILKYLLSLFFFNLNFLFLLLRSDEKEIFKLLANQSLLAPGEKAEFQWYKDGAPYDPEERFKVDFKVHYNFLH